MPGLRLGGWGWAVVGLSLAFVALRLWLSREMNAPFVFSDEIGYLLDARYLSGVDPPPEHPFVPYYSVGYPLLLAPLSWIFENPIGVYHAALLGNALLGGATIPILYRLGRELFGMAPRDAFFAAGLAGAYPAFLLHSNIAWAENLLPPLVALHFLLVYRSLVRGTLAWVIAPAVTGAALYATHPRTIPIVAVTALFLAVASWRRLIRFSHAGAAAGVLALLLLVGELLNDLVREAVYRGPIGGGPSKLGGTSQFVAGALEEPSRYFPTIVKAVGQAWYLCATSAGLWALGIGFMAAIVWRNRKPAGDSDERARAYTAAFTLLATLGSFVPNALIVSGTPSSTFFSVYGRYMESLSPVVLLAGAAAVLVLKGRRQRLLAIAGAAGATLLLTLIVQVDSPALDKAAVNVPAILAALYPAGISNWADLFGFDLWRATAIGLGGLAIIAVIPARRAPLAAVLVGAGFVFSALVTAERTIQPFAAALVSQETLQSTIETLPPGEPVSFELSSWLSSGFPQYQFHEDDRRFRIYDVRLGQRPETDVVLAKLDDKRLSREGARVVAFETHRDQALWIRPGPLQRRYAWQGRVFPRGVSSPLPRAARRSSISFTREQRLPLPVRSGLSAAVDLAVTHAGSGSPWRQPGTSPQTAGGGSVSVAASWLRADRRSRRISTQSSPLPRTLGPGATLAMRLTLVAVDSRGRALAPGRYLVELSPAQEGSGSFAESGDTPLLVPVEVTP